MKQFHAHVYFKESEILKGRELFNRTSLYTGDAFQAVKWFGTAVGPHPLPMVEIQFDEVNARFVKDWLNQNRKEFSVLIHEETGNDVRDHSENIEWLGEALPIYFDFFELILKHPELRIHPEHS